MKHSMQMAEVKPSPADAVNESRATLEESLDQLEAIGKIGRLKAQYCRAVDEKRWADLSQLLHPDAKLTFFGTQGEVLFEFADTQSWIDQCTELLVGAQTIHQVHNAEIDLVSSTQAEAIWSMEDWIIFPEGVAGPFKTMHGYGHYHERLERVNGVWIIRAIALKRTILEIKK